MLNNTKNSLAAHSNEYNIPIRIRCESIPQRQSGNDCNVKIYLNDWQSPKVRPG